MFWCITYIPFSVAVPVLGLSLVLSFTFYHIGKIIEGRTTSDEKEYNKQITQIELLKEILELPTIELFPEIQTPLTLMVAQKYDELGEEEKATKLRATIINI